MENKDPTDRRFGLEQEFFLVEESGLPSDRADEFLEVCKKDDGACVAPEFVKGLVEVSTPPVRLNRQGTVELRGLDSNYPDVTLTVAALIFGAVDRVRREGLEVRPHEDVRGFVVAGETLFVPGFAYLGTELLYEAVAGDLRGSGVSLYLDSILEFVGCGEERLAALRGHRLSTGEYPTTEAGILARRTPGNGRISEDEGLLLVREACDELEAQVFRLAE